MNTVIKLPVGDIVVQLNQSGGGKIDSNLHGDLPENIPEEGLANVEYDAAIDGLESLILAHACAGVNIQDKKYVKGIQSTLDAIANNF